jgi:VanZ family protein
MSLNQNLKHFLKYQVPAVLWGVFIFWASSIPASKLPKIALLINDKVIHAGIFLVLGLFVYYALEPKLKSIKYDWKRALIALAIVVLYGVIDEFHQSFVPGRSVDVLDASADATGGVLSVLVIYLGNKLKSLI